jgi:hypothetical protein
VRVSDPIRKCVVPTVNGNPLASYGGAREPQPEAKEMAQRGMEHEPAVGLVAVQVQADSQEHHLHDRERQRNISPEGELDQPIKKVLRHS